MDCNLGNFEHGGRAAVHGLHGEKAHWVCKKHATLVGQGVCRPQSCSSCDHPWAHTESCVDQLVECGALCTGQQADVCTGYAFDWAGLLYSLHTDIAAPFSAR